MKGDGKMSCADFIEIWRYYDTDKSGYLEEKVTQEPTDLSKQPIRTRYLGHVTAASSRRISVSAKRTKLTDAIDNLIMTQYEVLF